MFGFFILLRYCSTFLLALDVAVLFSVEGTRISILSSLDALAVPSIANLNLLRRLSLRID